MKNKLINPANILTLLRMLCSVLLFFIKPLSPVFSAVYVFCGITDAADGIVARKTHTVTRLGALLDSAADIVFFAAAVYTVLVTADIPLYVTAGAALCAAVRIANIVIGFVLCRRLVLLHTTANKITGLLLFILPLSLLFVDIKYAAPLPLVCALFASVQEGIMILRGKA